MCMLTTALGMAGKKKEITITSDMDRLSAEEIERMVEEAEQYAEQDKVVRTKPTSCCRKFCYSSSKWMCSMQDRHHAFYSDPGSLPLVAPTVLAR